MVDALSQQTGTFAPKLLAVLNSITSQMAALEQQRGAILAAYAEGAGLGEGNFKWHAETGAWIFAPMPPQPTPNGVGAQPQQ